MTQAALFERLAVVHRPGCAALGAGPEPAFAPHPSIVASLLRSESAAEYARACGPLYENLRRIIGQVAGLLILARLTDCKDVLGTPELAACERRWNEAAQQLGRLVAPAELLSHREQLAAAQEYAGLALRTFSQLGTRAWDERVIDDASGQIRRAYMHLSGASSDRAGLRMVDLSQACCCAR